MLYNNEDFPKYVRTAGKITVFTAIVGLVVFMFALVFDFGAQELNRVSAQNATTTLTVLNTPPDFVVDAYEIVESSTSSPTNSGDDVQWGAVAEDSNDAPYFLLVCGTNASPTAQAADDTNSLGTEPPECGDGPGVTWGVSAATPSGDQATVATTTLEAMSESNDWYAWVCDDDPVNPRCNNTPVQGYSATNSSPFNVNHRPVLTSVSNTGPVDPGAVIEFDSTSSDPDTVDEADAIYLVVCGDTSYNTTTNTCDSNFIASTTLNSILSDASATYTLDSIVRDDTYVANGYLVDEHGHEASANPVNSNFDVNNVAPTVLGGDINLNDGNDLDLEVPAGETTGFTLDFTLRDANSCVNVASTSEITDYGVAVFRTNHSTSTCDASAPNYDPNDCYVSGVATTTWDLSCSQTSTCSGPNDDAVDYSCTFPLWFVADPTDSGPNTPTAFQDTEWTAGIYGIDDDLATGTMSTTSNPIDLNSFSAISIEDSEIAYGAIEPGSDTGTLSATSTAMNVGNTGLDQEVQGESMCETFSVGNPCPVSASSTIQEDQQRFASSSLAYNSPLASSLSSTTPEEVELDVPKTTSTTTYNEADTHWGIAVPASISLAGSYQGLNTFTARTAEALDW